MRLPFWEPCSLQETTLFNQDPAARLSGVCPYQETGGLYLNRKSGFDGQVA